MFILIERLNWNLEIAKLSITLKNDVVPLQSPGPVPVYANNAN
jgi:hypothetical protein